MASMAGANGASCGGCGAGVWSSAIGWGGIRCSRCGWLWFQGRGGTSGTENDDSNNVVQGNDRKYFLCIKYYQCNSFGNFATQYPKGGNTGANFAQIGHVFTKMKKL